MFFRKFPAEKYARETVYGVRSDLPLWALENLVIMKEQIKGT